MKQSSHVIELFETHRSLRAVIESGLEGVVGRVITDGHRVPRVARLDIGCYCFLAGQPDSHAAAELVGGMAAPVEILVPDQQGWRDLLFATHGRCLVDRPMRAFSSEHLSLTHLRHLARAAPPEYQIRPLDRHAAEQLDQSLTPHALQVFDSVDRFLRTGFGYGAFRGNELASAATSYTVSSRSVEIAISTKAQHRSHGLAGVVAANMIIGAFERSLQPMWTASNPVSQRLARRLGYRPAGLCDIFYLEAVT